MLSVINLSIIIISLLLFIIFISANKFIKAFLSFIISHFGMLFFIFFVFFLAVDYKQASNKINNANSNKTTNSQNTSIKNSEINPLDYTVVSLRDLSLSGTALRNKNVMIKAKHIFLLPRVNGSAPFTAFQDGFDILCYLWKYLNHSFFYDLGISRANKTQDPVIILGTYQEDPQNHMKENLFVHKIIFCDEIYYASLQDSSPEKMTNHEIKSYYDLFNY